MCHIFFHSHSHLSFHLTLHFPTSQRNSFSSWWWKVYDHLPHDPKPLLSGQICRRFPGMEKDSFPGAIIYAIKKCCCFCCNGVDPETFWLHQCFLDVRLTVVPSCMSVKGTLRIVLEKSKCGQPVVTVSVTMNDGIACSTVQSPITQDSLALPLHSVQHNRENYVEHVAPLLY